MRILLRGFELLADGMAAIFGLQPKPKYRALTDEEAWEADRKALQDDWDRVFGGKP